MGQGYSMTTLSAGSAGIDVPELSHLAYEKALGEARFMKTIRARHRHGLVAIKVTMKPYSNMSFQKHISTLMNERKTLLEIPNALAYYNAFETSSNGYLVRQFVYSSLYDRISTRPFLEDIEKCWLAYQLLSAVRDCHSKQLYHGDIKTENVLVTSWNWLLLTDFSSAFKPAYLPEDNPAEFSFYFDIAGRRTCYLAPERFLHVGETQRSTSSLTWAMDIFSVGCVIAELFLETPIFNLSQLFNYKKGEYDPRVAHLDRIENTEIREMVSHMIQVEPESRYSADEYLNFWRGKAFPEYFSSFMHQYMALITDPSAGKTMLASDDSNLGESDDRISRVYYDFDKIAFFLGYSTADLPDTGSPPRVDDANHPLHINVPCRRAISKSKASATGDEGTFLFLNIVTSALRSTARSTARLQACDLLLAFSKHISDEAKLDRVLPFIMMLLDDQSDIVRIAGLRSLAGLINLIASASPVNAFVFPEYILPRLTDMLSTKRGKVRQSALVRLAFAQCIATLADSGARFLDSTEALKSEGSLPSANSDAESIISLEAYRDFYDSTRADLVRFFETHTKQLLTDSEPGVRRAFLGSIGSLCIFFGSAKTSDVLLSHLNTYLNDRDWKLKCSFFDAIVALAIYVGTNNLEGFILPLMILALTDVEEAVTQSVLRSLAVMASLGLFQRLTALGLIELVSRFSVHPNEWIREAASDFLASATKYLSAADRQCMVVPMLGQYLKLPPSSYEEIDVLDVLKSPITRAVYDVALKWAKNSDASSFWKHVQKVNALKKTEERFFAITAKELSFNSFAKILKSENDQQWISRLRECGMSREDEIKILVLSEYIFRIASKTSKDHSMEGTSATYDKQVRLSDLGVQVNTFQIDPDEDIWTGSAQQPELEDASQDKKPQTISDALLDASATIGDGDDLPEALERISLHREGSSTRAQNTTAVVGHGSGFSSANFPTTVRPSAKDIERASIDERIQQTRQSRGNAINLIQRHTTAGKASPELATSPANAQGHVNTHLLENIQQQGAKDAAKDSRSNRVLRSRHLALSGYGGRDPNVLRLLESLAVANHPPNPLELHPEIASLENRGLKQRGANKHPERPWEIDGLTVATFSEHTGPVTRVLVSPDHAFFLTASDDGTVRVWDTNRLERNVAHRSRQLHKHAPSVKVSALAVLENSYVFASAGTDGSLHLVQVETTELSPGVLKYNRVRLVRDWRVPGDSSHAVWLQHVRTRTSNNLYIATNTGSIHVLNLDTMTVDDSLRSPSNHGTPTCLCVGQSDQKWLLLGTSRGILSLWDLRFNLRLHSFQFPAACPITRIEIHPDDIESERQRVFVSGGLSTPEVTEWNIHDFKCTGTWRSTEAAQTVTPSSSKRQAAPNFRPAPDTKPYILLDVEKQSVSNSSERRGDDEGASETNEAYTRNDGLSSCVRSFVLGTIAESSDGAKGLLMGSREIETPYLFVAGPSTSLRLWNLKQGQTRRSLLISGPLDQNGETVSPSFEDRGSWSGITFHDELLPSNAAEGADGAGTRAQSADKKADHAGRPVTTATSKHKSKSGQARVDVGGTRVEHEPDDQSRGKASHPRLEQQNLLRKHLDLILDVAVIKRPYRMYVSVDRSGSIFVFS